MALMKECLFPKASMMLDRSLDTTRIRCSHYLSLEIRSLVAPFAHGREALLVIHFSE